MVSSLETPTFSRSHTSSGRMCLMVRRPHWSTLYGKVLSLNLRRQRIELLTISLVI
ncbi:hypothetical protein LINPERPRIM_LOCUS29837 [Linum perenne]